LERDQTILVQEEQRAWPAQDGAGSKAAFMEITTYSFSSRRKQALSQYLITRLNMRAAGFTKFGYALLLPLRSHRSWQGMQTRGSELKGSSMPWA
jgi:hypothetical protein